MQTYRTAKEVSFEWSHHRISSKDSKVRTTLHVSVINSESDELNCIRQVVVPSRPAKRKKISSVKTELTVYYSMLDATFFLRVSFFGFGP